MEQKGNKNRKGSSLVFVIIAVAFVGILSTIILRVTMINVETKGTDRSIKKNFYSTETVEDKLNMALQNISQDAMKTAYVSLLENYASVGVSTTDQNNVQNEFAKKYLNNLICLLMGENTASTLANNKNNKFPPENPFSEDEITATFQYKPSVLKTYIKNVKGDGEKDPSDYIDMKDDDKPSLELHFGKKSDYDAERYVLLKNARVKYTEDEKSTWITTDIKMVVPRLNFESGNIYPDFTKYAIIGSDGVTAQNGETFIYGNVYAGADGLKVSGDANDSRMTLTIGGSSSRLITRGDVAVQQSGGLQLGEEKTPIEVWTENYMTTRGTGAKAYLTVNGDSYVHDDLSLDAANSDVKFLSGRYFGYSFNKDNALNDTTDNFNSQYSSAIMINGRHSSLIMGGNLSSILLGGRAFISRNNDVGMEDGIKRNDIPIGESISVKSDQNFYLVSDDELKDGFTNPMPVADYKEKIKTETPLKDNAARRLRKYLNKGNPVTIYVYDFSAESTDSAMVYFYYNFKSQSAADQYFNDCCDIDAMGKKMVSSDYLRFPSGLDINLSESLTLLTMGNALAKNSETGKLETRTARVNESNEENLKKESVLKSAKYKSYQLTLTDSDSGKYASTGTSDGENGFNLTDKKADPIFGALMEKDVDDSYVFVKEAKSSNPLDYGFKPLTNANILCKKVEVDVKDKKVYVVFVVDKTSIEATPATSASAVDTTTGISGTNANVSLSELGLSSSEDTALIVTNCNINVNQSLHGLIISQNTAKFSTLGVKITAEPALLQEMFSTQKSKEGSLSSKERFLHYFKAFAGMSFGEDVKNTQDSVVFSNYIKYVNWKKNNE